RGPLPRPRTPHTPRSAGGALLRAEQRAAPRPRVLVRGQTRARSVLVGAVVRRLAGAGRAARAARSRARGRLAHLAAHGRLAPARAHCLRRGAGAAPSPLSGGSPQFAGGVPSGSGARSICVTCSGSTRSVRRGTPSRVTSVTIRNSYCITNAKSGCGISWLLPSDMDTRSLRNGTCFSAERIVSGRIAALLHATGEREARVLPRARRATGATGSIPPAAAG